MIPLGDEGTPPSRGFPYINIAIIVINFLVFFLELLYGDPIVNGWSLIPREITTGVDLKGIVDLGGATIQLYPAPLGNVYLTLLTSMFMHGGWLHIGSNMLFLFIFGDNVEDNFGHIKYLIFYLICGFAADFAQIILGGSSSEVPNLGASGAIAGVLAAYLILFPQAQIRSLVPLGFFVTVFRVPAIIMIGIWIVTQLISLFPVAEQGSTGVAYGAHIGGFVAGLLLVFLFRSRGTPAPAYFR
jgi:membrane associated rhomboid family serine protease